VCSSGRAKTVRTFVPASPHSRLFTVCTMKDQTGKSSIQHPATGPVRAPTRLHLRCYLPPLREHLWLRAFLPAHCSVHTLISLPSSLLSFRSHIHHHGALNLHRTQGSYSISYLLSLPKHCVPFVFNKHDNKHTQKSCLPCISRFLHLCTYAKNYALCTLVPNAIRETDSPVGAACCGSARAVGGAHSCRQRC